MKIKVERRRICIEPDNKIDEAYIEEVLGLKNDGECAICKRVEQLEQKGVWGKGEMVLVIEKVKIKE